MHLPKFDRFIGIDWSGAIDSRRGLRIAQCFNNAEPPQIVLNGEQNKWRRKKILNWLIEINKAGDRVLAGFDFAFAYPYCDEGDYFPGHDLTPQNKAKSLWKMIDSICLDEGDFYGGTFYLSEDAPFSEFLLYQTYKGKHHSNRLRITENYCAKIGCNPSSVFKCIGQDSVGIGSVASMRLLHYTVNYFNKEFLIWPFEDLDNRRSVFAEIFPRFFFMLAGENPQKWKNRTTINNTLKWFGSAELPSNIKIESEDQIDAIISAAALRHLSTSLTTWYPKEIKGCARIFEGWIFGV